MSIVFNPSKISREYGTNIYFEKNKVSSRIQYRTTVQYAGLFMHKYPIFHLDKHDVYINNQELHDYSYTLAYECSRAFYPLVIICNLQGQIIGMRTDLIHEKWNKLKKNIEQKFGGESTQNYIRQIEYKLYNKSSLFELIHRDLFFSTYFSLNYDRLADMKINLLLPVVAFDSPLQTDGYQSVNKELNGKVLIEQTGCIIDSRRINYNRIWKNDINESHGKIEGSYSIKYTIDCDSVIDSINGTYKLQKEKDVSSFSQTRIQSYYLREYSIDPIHDIETIKLGEQMSSDSRNKKGFFSWFKNL